MTWRKGRGGFSSRCPALLLALAVLAAGISFAPSTALAQEVERRIERPWLLKRLFPRRQGGIFLPRQEVEPGPQVVRPRTEVARPRAKKKKTRIVREDVNPQVSVVVKRPDARVVLVVGDFLGSGLAEGLTTVFTQNPRVRVVDRTNGSSGFVRDDFYNWPQKIGELMDREKPAVVVVMLGTNDRQEMQVGDVTETVRSENWTKEYSARAQALAKAISDKKVPFLWVGVPAFKSSKMLLDMLAFNDVYRAAAASAGAGAEFIDIWDGFVDENGAYMSNGPDINGQPARLRAADGINLARPGKRKVAFYAEKPLYRLLGETPLAPGPGIASPTMETPSFATPPMGMADATAPGADLDIVVGPSEVGPVDPARPIPLRSPAIDGGTELLGLVAEPKHDARTPGEKLAIEGIAPAALPGRADDFSWPQSASTALALALATPDATSAKAFVPAILPEPVNFVAPPKAPPAEALIPPPAPMAEAVPTTLPTRIILFLPPKAVPSDVVLVAPIPAGVETTKAKGRVSESVVSGPREIPAVTIAPRGPTKLPKTSGPEAEPAPAVLLDRAEDTLVLQAAPTEVSPLPATLTPAEAEVMAAKGAVSEALSGPTGDVSPMRLVPRRAVKLPASIGPIAAEAVPTTPPDLVESFSPQRIVPAEAAPAPVVIVPTGKDAPLAPPPDGAEDLSSPATAPQAPPTDLTAVTPAAPSLPAASSIETAQPAMQAQPPALVAPTVLPETADGGSSTQAAPSAPPPAPPAPSD